jgi:hypothetical protein
VNTKKAYVVAVLNLRIFNVVIAINRVAKNAIGKKLTFGNLGELVIQLTNMLVNTPMKQDHIVVIVVILAIVIAFVTGMR